MRDGELVRAGQPLIMVGDVRNDAELSLLLDQLDAERIRNARASAEAALAIGLQKPVDLSSSPRVTEHLVARAGAVRRAPSHAERADRRRCRSRFATRRRRPAHSRSRSSPPRRPRQLAAEELQINEKLVRDGFVQRARLLQLQREASDYRSRLSESQSDLALARQRTGEIQARIVQARNQYQQQATDEAKESAAKMREIQKSVRARRGIRRTASSSARLSTAR